MNTIWIGNYNNYYNRIHKPIYASAALYSQNGYTNTHAFSNINFNRADSINTKLTINLNPATTDYNDHVNPDYLLVCTGATYNPVESRWFILESEWNRDHQLVLTLRRDLISDFWDNFKSNDFYCEKGPIPAGYDVAKYNSEGMTFNQQLKGRYYLKPSDMGSSDKRYLVGYVDKTWSGGNIVYADVYAEYDSVLDCPLYSAQGVLQSFDEPEQVKYVVRFSSEAPSDPAVQGNGFIIQGHWDADGTNYGGHVTASTSVLNLIGEENITSTDANALEDYIGANAGQSFVEYALSEWESGGARINDEVRRLDGKLIRIGDSFYTVSLSSYTYNNTPIYAWRAIAVLQTCILQDRPDSYNYDVFQPEFGSWPRSEFIYLQHTVTTVTLTAYTGSVISLYDRVHIDTVPYDIFYIEDSTAARKFCGYLASRMMKGNVVYDIQLLPFHPEAATGTGSSVSLPDGSTLYWAKNDYAYGNLSGAPTLTYSTDTEYKVASNTSTCRLYSPDGASCWEFNPAKIGGIKDGASNKPIKYEVTFAPLLVYMHIFPTFGGIYGSVNKTLGENKEAESRGLVCRGDYSIPYSSNNWAAYQLQNSAYQLSHDRMITNMSVSHEAERAQELVNILSGTVSGAFAGAQSGAMMGGAYGAVAGGIVGGAGSLAGGLVGRSWNERLRSEEMSYAEDMFAYSLQNIQMQAQPLSHSNYITVGNAYYPYLEVYECTDTEKTIMTERLRINGWSLGIVTTMAAMKTAASASGTPTSFVKGRLVKFGGNDDAHVSAEIDKELQRGVRFS